MLNPQSKFVPSNLPLEICGGVGQVTAAIIFKIIRPRCCKYPQRTQLLEEPYGLISPFLEDNTVRTYYLSHCILATFPEVSTSGFLHLGGSG